jgi:hypothetical protein
MFKRWCAKHRLPESPPRFEPRGEQSLVRLKQRPGKKRRRPQFENALAAIRARYPNGVPDQTTVPNKILCRLVREKAAGDPGSDDTILRAAGRRK